MGLSSFFGKARAIGSRVIGGIGSTLRKVADFAAPVVRKVGQLAKPVADVAAGVSMALGHPELAGLFKGVSKVAGYVHNTAPKVNQMVDKAGALGSKIQNYGEALKRE